MYALIFQLTGKLEGVRVGIVKEGFVDSECDVATIVDTRSRSLTQFGATVNDISIPLHLKGICSTL
jgi:amidase